MNGPLIIYPMNSVTTNIVNSIIHYLGRSENESGGLIGSSNGSTVDAFFFDPGIECSAKEYNPDIELLQKQIMIWDAENIEFKGIIHSHRDERFLSNKDVYMARKILNVNSLTSILMPVYFMNNKSIFWYSVGMDNVKSLSFEIITE